MGFFELNVWGLAYYGLQLETKHHDIEGLHTYELAGALLLFIFHAGTMYKHLGYSGPVLMGVKLSSILGVPLLHAAQGFITAGSVSPLDDELELEIETTTQALVEKYDAIAIDLYRRIFFALNWPRLVETPQHAEDVLRKAYQFNNWTVPPAWKI